MPAIKSKILDHTNRLRRRTLTTLLRMRLLPRIPFCGSDAIAHKLRPFELAKETKKSQAYLMSMIRMHAHIVDKGLNREDWEYGHSSKCVSTLRQLISKCKDTNDPSIAWANEVLCRYESKSPEHNTLNTRPAPINREFSPELLYAMMRRRTSTRTLSDRKVPEHFATQIASAALEAPSSCHRQTLNIYGTVNQEMAAKIGSCFKGFTGFSNNVPIFFVFCADLTPYSFPSELFTPAVDTALAAQNAMLYASELGISLTPLNWTGPPSSDDRLRSLLNIPAHHQIFLGAAGGFATQSHLKPVRKSVASTLQLRTENTP